MAIEPNPTNPYAAPSAQPGAAFVGPLDKRARTNLINRRSVGVLIEMTIWCVTGGLAVRALLAALGLDPSSFGTGTLTMAPYWLLRDMLGLAAWSRRRV